MDSKKLDLIVCFHCNNTFFDKEEVYTISCGEMNDLNVCIIPKTLTFFDKEYNEIQLRRCIHFHKKCFVDIAGNEYLP